MKQNQTTKQSVFAISRKITQKQADNYQRRANRNEEEQRKIRDDLPKHKPKAQTKITSAERINQ